MLGKERDDWLRAVAVDWRTAKLSGVDRALCVFAEKLTLVNVGGILLCVVGLWLLNKK